MSNPIDVDSQFEVVVGDLGPSQIRVALFKGWEEMNGLYRFDIHFRLIGANDFHEKSDLLYSAARLAIRTGSGGADPIVRAVDGIVTHVEASGVHKHGGATGSFRLAPRMAMLKVPKNSRIFQNRTVREIVDEVLARHDVPVEWRLTSTYPKRAYCTQYQETDYDFVTRLLAEEGLFFFFEQPASSLTDPLAAPLTSGATDTVIIADDVSAYRPIFGWPTLDSGNSEQSVSVFQRREKLGPERLIRRVQSYLNPNADPLTRTYEPRDFDGTGIDYTRMQIYEHHDEYEAADVARNVTQVQLEQYMTDSYRGWGTGPCRRLVPGHWFDLEGHEQHHVDGRYYLTRVEHVAHSSWVSHENMPDYMVIFRCNQGVPYRPPRPSRAPREVVLTGTVVGPANKEIHTDDLGRVQVRLHWAEYGSKDTSSPFLRVVTPWAGPSFGVQTVPRVGMEVLVAFIGGDLDNPVVMGCLYNGIQPPPFRSADGGRRCGIVTRSTPGNGAGYTGWNELSFDDTAGSEKVSLRAERDFDTVVGGSSSTTIQLDTSLRVGGSSTLVVDNHVSETIGGDRRTEVKGDQVLRVQKDRIDWVRGNRMDTVMGSSEVHVGKHLHARVDGQEDHRVGRDHRFEVMGHHTERFHQGSTTVIAGDHRVLRQLHVEGGSLVSTSQDYAVDAGDEIRLTCGKSTLRLLPDSIELVSPEIRLEGPKVQVRLREGEIEIKAKDLATMKAEKAAIRSSDARVLLGKEAKIEGTKVKFNCAPEPNDDVFPEDTKQPTHIEIKDQKGRPLAHRHYQIMSGDRDIAGGLVGKDGTDDIVLEEGDSIVFPSLGNVRRQS